MPPLILNGTTGVSGIDGSAGTPSYQGGDSNTGVFFPAADTIAFAEGGVEVARFDSSGNLGIGTSSPNSNGGASATVCHINNSGVGNWAVNHYTTGSTGSNAADGLIVGVIGSDAYLFNYENANMLFATNNAERMRITSGGDIGVGTTTPSAKVQIFKTAVGANASTVTPANTALALQYDSSTVYGYHYMNGGGVYFIDARNNGVAGGNICLWGQNEVQFRTAGLDTDTPRMVINSSGNVGIGTSSPSARLMAAQSNPTRGIIARFNNTATSSQTGAQIQLSQNSVQDWAFGQPAGVDAFAFWSGRDISGGDGTERMRITSGGDIAQTCATLNGAYIRAQTFVSVANSSTLNITALEAGAVIVCVYDTGSGNGGLFFGTYTGNMVKIAGNGEATDTGSGIAVYKSTNSHTITFKNRGSTGNFCFGIYSASAIR